MRHRYPFDALHWLRHKRVDRQTEVVSESALRTAQARNEEARAEAVRKSGERAVSELARAEQELLEDGQMRAGDLQVVGDWRKGADAELHAKLELEQRTREAAVTQAAVLATARRALGVVSNEAKMIETHRGDWRAERDAAHERAEEEAATEQWTARRYPPRQS